MHDKRLVKVIHELIEKINYHDELYYKKTKKFLMKSMIN